MLAPKSHNSIQNLYFAQDRQYRGCSFEILEHILCFQMSCLEIVALSPGDMLAISMTALLSFALGMIATILFTMARSSSSADKTEDELLETEDQNVEDRTPEAAGESSESPRKFDRIRGSHPLKPSALIAQQSLAQLGRAAEAQPCRRTGRRRR